MSGVVRGAQGWRLSVTLGRAAFEALEDAFGELADAVVAETVAAAHPARDDPSDAVRATLFGAGPAADDPRPARLLALLHDAGAAADGASVEPVDAADWAARSLAALPPVSVGRFTIAEANEDPPRGRLVVSVAAGPAFGSGRHETTQGCLLALDRLARHRRVRRALDIGTGSGILAVAAARLWPARVLALDNDSMAVAAARETVRRNALSRRVTVMQGEGFRTRPGTRLGRADLICANIRARPIAALAPAFARHLQPGGVAVLSGLLAVEEPLVLAAFRAVRLRLRRRLRLGDWATLILTP
ncbi:MAG: 50S ribosomal protein L11 methyltransferase [Rhodospirillales bacterium]|nr:50S ribosomal protein L11 methyltransferase [Rhodospirillales bacterium]MDE0380906.1 50S ribosomal protein L11 methyltransferase [Rhodospirillales bacterium]